MDAGDFLRYLGLINSIEGLEEAWIVIISPRSLSTTPEPMQPFIESNLMSKWCRSKYVYYGNVE